MCRNLRISNLGVIKALEIVMVLYKRHLFNEARGTEIQLTIDALPSESSDDFSRTISVTTADILVPLSRWIIDNLKNLYVTI